MSSPYHIGQGNNWRRQAVQDWLFGLDRVSPEVQARIVTAWVSAWASSTHAALQATRYG